MGTMSARYSDRLIMRFGARRTLIPGLVLILVALALFTRAPVGRQLRRARPAGDAAVGFGTGMTFPALMTLAMSGVERSEAGLASGLVNTTAQVGGALGLAVLATVSASRSDDLIADGEARPQALTSGYHLAFLIGAGARAAAIVVALTVMRPARRPRRSTGRARRGGDEVAYSEAA